MRLFRTSLSLCIAVTVVAACASFSNHNQDRNDFDTDRDGYLSPEEYSASKLSEVLKFEELDKDGDGLLSEAELGFGGVKGDSKQRGKRGNGGRTGERRSET